MVPRRTNTSRNRAEGRTLPNTGNSYSKSAGANYANTGADQRMPNSGVRATNIAPRFNNNAGSQAQGRARLDPREAYGGFNNTPERRVLPSPGRQPERPQNWSNWSNQRQQNWRQDQRPLPRDRGPNLPGGGNKGMPETPERDYFAELNAFQADIGGDPGDLTFQSGWGGIGGQGVRGGAGGSGLGSMRATKLNSWLNTFTDPTERAKAMNAVGYYNQGNPYTPEAAKGTNRFYKGNARANAETGAMSAPGTYLHQSGGYGAGPGVAPDLNFGGYIGSTTVGDDLSARYTAFDPNYRGGNNARRNPGPRPGGNQGPGGGGSKQGGGIPRTDGGGQGGGGGGNNGGRGGNQGGANRGGQRPGYPGTGTPGGVGSYANIPAPQSPEDNFLPMTPQFEAGRRGLADEQMAQQTDILAQQALVDPLYQQQKARLETDRQYDVERMKENLAGRGVFTPYGAGSYQQGNVMGNSLSTGGGIGESLGRRDIQIPYGRQFSDLGTNAFNQYGGYNNQYADTELAYNQGMAELLLGRAADAAEMMPMNVPQYSTGKRILRAQGYNNRPNKPPKKNSRRNRGRK